MSSQEELTFIVGRFLWPFESMLDVVRRVSAAPTSSREQVRTQPHSRFGRDSFDPRSET
jgi:hypothetical protein